MTMEKREAKLRKTHATREQDMFKFTEPKLPEDLVFNEILLKLPVKTLMRFKCVSKSWLTRISGDSFFISAHLNHHVSNTDYYSQNSIVLGSYKQQNYDQYGPTDFTTRQRVALLSDPYSKATEIDISYIGRQIFIVGSCNGLVCLEVLEPGECIPGIALWNPATRQLRNVTTETSQTEDVSVSLLGFGFDEESKDYKIVRVVSTGMGLSLKSGLKGVSTQVRVFSKKSRTWRGGREEEGAALGLSGHQFGSRVVANGALYWVAYKKDEVRNTYTCILYFSLRDEVLRVTDTPGGVRCKGSIELCKWKGSIAALEFFYPHEGCLWVAKTGDNDKQSLSWIKMMKINTTEWTSSLRGVWRDQFLLMKQIKQGSELALQDQYGRAMTLRETGPCWTMYNAHDYIESLVSVF